MAPADVEPTQLRGRSAAGVCAKSAGWEFDGKGQCTHIPQQPAGRYLRPPPGEDCVAGVWEWHSARLRGGSYYEYVMPLVMSVTLSSYLAVLCFEPL